MPTKAKNAARYVAEDALRKAAREYAETLAHHGNMGPTITGMFLLDHEPTHRALMDAAIAFALTRPPIENLITAARQTVQIHDLVQDDELDEVIERKAARAYLAETLSALPKGP